MDDWIYIKFANEPICSSLQKLSSFDNLDKLVEVDKMFCTKTNFMQLGPRKLRLLEEAE